MAEPYDIVIAGGGPVGSALALSLRDKAKALATSAGDDLANLPEPAIWNPGVELR